MTVPKVLGNAGRELDLPWVSGRKQEHSQMCEGGDYWKGESDRVTESEATSFRCPMCVLLQERECFVYDVSLNGLIWAGSAKKICFNLIPLRSLFCTFRWHCL